MSVGQKVAERSPVVLVTGALGGLGSMIAALLDASDARVVAVDNHNPASAHYPEHQHRLQLLSTREGVELHLIDVRSREFADLINGLEKLDCVVHAASISPIRRPEPDSETIRELANTIPLELAGMIGKYDGCRLLLLQHLPATGEGDTRSEDEVWKILLDAEADTRNELRENSKVEIVSLPNLVGMGQSLYSSPMNALFQMISGLPVVLPEQDIPLLAMDPSVVSEAIVEAVFEGEKPFLQQPFATPTVREFAEALGRQLELDQVDFAEEKSAPPGLSAGQVVAVANADQLAQHLLEYSRQLPFIPPADWPTSSRKRNKKSKHQQKQES